MQELIASFRSLAHLSGGAAYITPPYMPLPVQPPIHMYQMPTQTPNYDFEDPTRQPSRPATRPTHGIQVLPRNSNE